MERTFSLSLCLITVENGETVAAVAFIRVTHAMGMAEGSNVSAAHTVPFGVKGKDVSPETVEATTFGTALLSVVSVIV